MNNESNPVGWFEIYVQDMNRARAFYEATLETKLEKLPGADFPMFVFPMRPELPGSMGALVHMEGKPSGGCGTLVYFSCKNCATEVARALKNGGKLFRDKMSIGEYGFIALIFDTEENMIGLHSME